MTCLRKQHGWISTYRQRVRIIYRLSWCFRIFFRLQQVDNSFFERFGSLFREHSELTAAQERAEKERVAKAAAQTIPEENETGNDVTEVKTISDEGDATGVSDSDGEEPDKADIVGVGLYVSFQTQ